MTRLIIEVPDDVAERLADLAAQRGVAPERLAADVLTERFGLAIVISHSPRSGPLVRAEAAPRPTTCWPKASAATDAEC